MTSILCAGLLAVLSASAPCVHAADLQVVAPNAVKEAVTEIAARFQRDTGQRVQLTWSGSEAISKRVAEGAVFDVVVNTSAGVGRMAADGHLAGDSRIDFCRSGVAAAARADLPVPDVSSVVALKAALLGARSIAISSGASGRHLEQLFETLGVAGQIKGKVMQPPSGAQISELLARGEADLGFQQAPELIHAKGIAYLGLLPPEVQNFTTWTAAAHARAPLAELARAFSRALAAPGSAALIRQSGLDPL
jgi:molybdate transport system substrate-binding protein